MLRMGWGIMQFDDATTREALAWLKGSKTLEGGWQQDCAGEVNEPGAMTYYAAAARLSRHTATEDMPNNVQQLKALIKEMQFTISLLRAITEHQRKRIVSLREALERSDALRHNDPFDL